VTVELVSEAKEPDWSALLERAPRAINEMFNDLTALVPRIAASDPDLAEVVTVTINADAFKMSPAASGMHHAYIGGLLEHTLGVAQAAIAMTPPGMDNAYILAGAILHDVGKCEEYTMTGKIRPAGKLIGHAALGVSSFLSLASGFKIPEADKQRVAHLIAAHHGRREWGAIVEPQTVEAWVVHFADMLDARLFTERKEAEARS
jgi:3'-5' exoribonuclease